MATKLKHRSALSLRATLTIAFLAIGIITPILSGGLLLFSQIKMQRTIIYGSQKMIAQDAADKVAGYIDTRFRTLDTALWLTEMENPSTESMKLLLESLLGFDRSFVRMLYLDTQMKPVAGVNPLPSGSHNLIPDDLDEKIKAGIRDNKKSIGSVYINPLSAEPMIIMGTPAFTLLGDHAGYLIAEVNLKYIRDLVNTIRVGKNGLAYVVNANGDLIASRDSARVLKGENLAKLKPVHDFINGAVSGSSGEVNTYRGIDGTLVVGTCVALNTPDWAVVAETPIAEAYHAVITNALTALFISIVIAFSAGIMGVYLAGWISVPLSHLTQTAKRIASGEISLRASVNRPEEAAQLANAFNSMTAQLQQSLEALEQRLAEIGRAEGSLRRANETLQSLIDNSPLAFVMVDTQNRVMLWNSAAEAMYEWKQEEVLDMPLPLYRDKAALNEFHTLRERVACGEIFTDIETEHLRKEGGVLRVAYSLSPIRGADGGVYAFMIIAADITGRKLAEEERSKLEMQLIQAQKMDSIGRLAGGVAHDFNNMLSVILGYADLIKSQLRGDDPLYPYICDIEKAGLHSRDITRQLLAFSRKQLIEPKPVNLNELITNTRSTLARLIGEDITLEFQPEPNLWPVRLDPAQVDQILVNLAINARDAMPKGGSVIIKTQNIFIDENYPLQHYESNPGPHVMLEVSDTGIGMDGETASRIFEPFFTTKQPGKGTGLGLATVYGIAKQNNGFISVYSEPGQGTTFRTYFPRFSQNGVEAQKAEESPPIQGSETVLLVEDDTMVRDLTKKMLEKTGYTVIAAESPTRALELCESPDIRFDLLITDVIMPEMSGPELRDMIEAKRPHTKALFISGYTSDIIAHRGVIDKGVQLLQKPFSLSDLTQKVRQIIDSG